MMKTFKKIWWRLLFALYAFIYLPWFFYLEHKITMDYPGIHILNGTIDSYIPFLEIFIIPYLLWFVYIAASCIYMVLKADNKEFIRFALSLIIGMSVSMFICMIYPNGLTLRPDNIPDNILESLLLYSMLPIRQPTYFQAYMYIIQLPSTLPFQSVRHLKSTNILSMLHLYYVYLYACQQYS